MHPSTLCASEPAAAQPVSIADLYALRLAELEAESAARNARMAAEPVAAEPVAAEPVAAEPVAAEPVAASWLRRAWHRLTGVTPVSPVTVLRYHGCRDGWRVVGVRANRAQAERLLSIAQRVNPAATLKLR
jgi:hypothetical protein